MQIYETLILLNFNFKDVEKSLLISKRCWNFRKIEELLRKMENSIEGMHLCITPAQTIIVFPVSYTPLLTTPHVTSRLEFLNTGQNFCWNVVALEYCSHTIMIKSIKHSFENYINSSYNEDYVVWTAWW